MTNLNTCIVALKCRDKSIIIGADSAGTDSAWLSSRHVRDEKVFRNGDFLFGCTSSYRMLQLLRYSFDPPDRKAGQSRESYMATDFIEAVRKLFKDYGFAKIQHERHDGGTFIVVYDGEIYRVQDNYACLRHGDFFLACGCGEEYALGALHVTEPMEDEVGRVLKALRTAAHFSAGVRGPFHVICTDHPDDTHEFEP